MALRHLGKNPLICDCKLKWLNEYFRTKPVERSGITCNLPKRLAKKSIGSISNTKFKCYPSRRFTSNEYCGQPVMCPRECNCFGSIVDCNGKQLVEIPRDIPEYATEL